MPRREVEGAVAGAHGIPGEATISGRPAIPPAEADHDLATRFASGDSNAFDRVVVVYAPRVARLAQRLLGWRTGSGWTGAVGIDDIVQDVFVSALRRRSTFRGAAVGRIVDDRPGETDEPGTGRRDELWSWLATITVNRCRSLGRRNALWSRWFSGRAHEARGGAPDLAAADASESGGLEREETRRRVREAVQRLPARDREVVVLFHLEELPAAEVAAIVGDSRNAVEVRLHRARKRLAEIMSRGPQAVDIEA